MKKKILSRWTNLAEPKTVDGKITVEIFIEGVIGWYWWESDENVITTMEEMRKELVEIEAIKADRINVYIACLGGHVDHALQMHDLLKKNPAEVATYCSAMTASAATILAQSANPGLRFMSDNSLYLVHLGGSCMCGNRLEAQVFIQDLTKVDERIANLYAKASGRTPEECMLLMERNNGRGEWLSPTEALAEKVVDQVYEPLKVTALYLPSNKEVFNNLGLPPVSQEKIFNISNKNTQVIIAPVNKANEKTEETKTEETPTPEKMAKTKMNFKTAVNLIKTKSIQNLTPEESADVDEAIKAADALSKMLTELKTGTAPDDTATNVFKTIRAKIADKKAGKAITNLTPDEDTQLNTAITLIQEGVTMAAELTNDVETTTTNKTTPVNEVEETPEQMKVRIKNLETQNSVLASAVAASKVTETKIENGEDANPGGATQKSKNTIANDLNAAALRG